MDGYADRAGPKVPRSTQHKKRSTEKFDWQTFGSSCNVLLFLAHPNGFDQKKKKKDFFDPYCLIHTHLAYNWRSTDTGYFFFSSRKGWPFNGRIDAAILPRGGFPPSSSSSAFVCVYMCSCYNFFHCYCRLYSFYWLLQHTRPPWAQSPNWL
jgi:hypothetical protein